MSTAYATKEDLNYAATVQKRMFVAKEEGKSLISDTDVQKLGGIAEGAQVNVLERISVNGVAVPVTEKGVNITIPTDYQTEEQVQNAINDAISGVYKVKGSVAFASLPSTGNKAGYVYNVTDAFTTTSAFKEGAGNTYPAGTNVVWTEEGKWDCLAGVYDFSDFLMKSDIGEITESDIEAMYE